MLFCQTNMVFSVDDLLHNNFYSFFNDIYEAATNNTQTDVI